LGSPFYVEWPSSAIKPYPTGSLTHAALDVAFDLVRTHEIEPGDVEHVAVGSNSNLFGSLIHSDARDGLEAKFSMPACMALAFVERAAGIAQLSDSVIGRRDIREFMRKVELYVDPELEALGFDQPRAVVKVRLTDGRVRAGRADVAQGTPAKPLHREQLLAKFSDCATLVISKARADEINDVVNGLENEPKMDRLARLLQGS
jgi:2-methylcitrate dehydratase PrpD